MFKIGHATAYVAPLACLVWCQCADDPTEEHCNDLVEQGPVYDVVYASGTVPAPTGGTIEDGVYHESAGEIFDASHPAGPSGQQRSMMSVISGETWQTICRQTDSTTTLLTPETYVISSAEPDAGVGQLVMRRVCPAKQATTIPFSYSFTGTGSGATLQIIIPGPPAMVFTSNKE